MNKKKFTIIVVVLAVIIAMNVSLSACVKKKGSYKGNELWSLSDTFKEDMVFEVDMPADGEFNILQLADIQCSKNDDSWDTAKHQIELLIEKEQPDLLVLTGDNAGDSHLEKMYKLLIEYMETLNLPWTIVFGNHEDDWGTDPTYLADLLAEAKTEHLLFKRTPSNITGATNYIVNVIDRQNSNKVVYSLQMIDSNTRYYDSKGDFLTYDYIGFDQIAYFEWLYNGMETHYGQHNFPSMAFYHLPPAEFMSFMDELVAKQKQAGKPTEKEYFPMYAEDHTEFFNYQQYDKSNTWEFSNDNYANTVGRPTFTKARFVAGEFREGIYGSHLNTGIFDSGKNTNTTHTFVGHEHQNAATAEIYKNDYSQFITYGLKLGEGSYHAEDMQGGTIINITRDGDVSIDFKYINKY